MPTGSLVFVDICFAPLGVLTAVLAPWRLPLKDLRQLPAMREPFLPASCRIVTDGATASTPPSHLTAERRNPRVAVRLRGASPGGSSVGRMEAGVGGQSSSVAEAHGHPSDVAAHALLLRGAALLTADYLLAILLLLTLPLTFWRLRTLWSRASIAGQVSLSAQHAHVLGALVATLALSLADLAAALPLASVVVTGWRLWPLRLRLRHVWQPTRTLHLEPSTDMNAVGLHLSDDGIIIAVDPAGPCGPMFARGLIRPGDALVSIDERRCRLRLKADVSDSTGQGDGCCRFFLRRLDAHAVVLTEFGMLVVELPLALCFLLITLTAWRAWPLQRVLAAEGGNNARRRRVALSQLLLWLLDPLALAASLIVLPSWRGPTLVHLLRSDPRRERGVDASSSTTATSTIAAGATRRSANATASRLPSAPVTAHVVTDELDAGCSNELHFADTPHAKAFSQLLELLIDLPFVLSGGVLLLLPWRLALCVRDCLQTTDAPSRRGSVARHLILALLDLSVVPAALLLLLTGYRLPGAAREIWSKQRAEEAAVDGTSGIELEEHMHDRPSVASAGWHANDEFGRRRRVYLQPQRLARNARSHVTVLSEAGSVVVDAPFLLMGLLPFLAIWRTLEFLRDVRAAPTAILRRRLCATHFAATLIDLPFVAIALAVHVVGFWRTSELLKEVMSASHFSEVRIVYALKLLSVMLDLPCILVATLTLAAPWRLVLLVRESCSSGQDAKSRRRAAIQHGTLAPLDIACLLLAVPVVLSVYRWRNLLERLRRIATGIHCDDVRRRAEAALPPPFHLHSATPHFSHFGLSLRIAASKDASFAIGPGHLWLTVDGEEFWKAVASIVPSSMVRIARNFVLPLSLIPDLVPTFALAAGKSDVAFEITLAASGRAKTRGADIQKGLDKLRSIGDPAMTVRLTYQSEALDVEELEALGSEAGSAASRVRRGVLCSIECTPGELLRAAREGRSLVASTLPDNGEEEYGEDNAGVASPSCALADEASEALAALVEARARSPRLDELDPWSHGNTAGIPSHGRRPGPEAATAATPGARWLLVRIPPEGDSSMFTRLTPHIEIAAELLQLAIDT